MRVIYKYPFTSGSVLAPDGIVRLIADQHGTGLPTIWIEHRTCAPVDTVYFIMPTGQEFSDNITDVHIGSAVCGPYVWHVFKRVHK